VDIEEIYHRGRTEPVLTAAGDVAVTTTTEQLFLRQPLASHGTPYRYRKIARNGDYHKRRDSEHERRATYARPSRRSRRRPAHANRLRAATHVRQTGVLPAPPAQGADLRRRHAERFRTRGTDACRAAARNGASLARA